MSLRVRLSYLAQYSYAREVSFSPHLLRLFPRSEPGRAVQGLDLRLQPAADVQFRRDAVDNNVARAFLPDRARQLQISLTAELELRQTNAFHFLVDGHASRWPFEYTPAQRLRLGTWLAPLAATESAPSLGFWEPRPQAETVAMLVDLVAAVHQEIRYEPRATGAAQTPAETLQRRAGACRDTSRLLRAQLHQLGFASRLVSGYLWEPRSLPDERRRAEGAFHAWAEVFVPGAGWIGLDGTNGVFCDHHFVPCAAGLDADDITPVLGSYFADEPVESTMQSSLVIEELPS